MFDRGLNTSLISSKSLNLFRARRLQNKKKKKKFSIRTFLGSQLTKKVYSKLAAKTPKLEIQIYCLELA